jgi:hypothetical protein
MAPTYLKQGEHDTIEIGQEVTETVRDILGHVRARGDEALRELARKFDHVEREHLRVTDDEIEAAREQLSADKRAGDRRDGPRHRLDTRRRQGLWPGQRLHHRGDTAGLRHRRHRLPRRPDRGAHGRRRARIRRWSRPTSSLRPNTTRTPGRC